MKRRGLALYAERGISETSSSLYTQEEADTEAAAAIDDSDDEIVVVIEDPPGGIRTVVREGGIIEILDSEEEQPDREASGKILMGPIARSYLSCLPPRAGHRSGSCRRRRCCCILSSSPQPGPRRNESDEKDRSISRGGEERR